MDDTFDSRIEDAEPVDETESQQEVPSVSQQMVNNTISTKMQSVHIHKIRIALRTQHRTVIRSGTGINEIEAKKVAINKMINADKIITFEDLDIIDRNFHGKNHIVVGFDFINKKTVAKGLRPQSEWVLEQLQSPCLFVRFHKYFINRIA